MLFCQKIYFLQTNDNFKDEVQQQIKINNSAQGVIDKVMSFKQWNLRIVKRAVVGWVYKKV